MSLMELHIITQLAIIHLGSCTNIGSIHKVIWYEQDIIVLTAMQKNMIIRMIMRGQKEEKAKTP